LVLKPIQNQAGKAEITTCPSSFQILRNYSTKNLLIHRFAKVVEVDLKPIFYGSVVLNFGFHGNFPCRFLNSFAIRQHFFRSKGDIQ